MLPGGRLLLKAGWIAEVRNTAPDFPWFAQYRWLGLPDMKVTPHPYLAGDYPMRDQVVTLSPDLAHLAFGRETYTKSGQNLYGGVSVSVLLAGLDGNETSRIGQPFTADAVNRILNCGDGISWSADSRVFAFTRSTQWRSAIDAPQLYVYELETGQFQTLTLRAKQPSAFAIAPGGAQIAFTAIETGPDAFFNLYLINADGSNEHLLVKGRISSNLVWHPDGKRIFFVNGQPELGIYSVDVSTGAMTLITATSDRANCLALSPDLSLLSYDDGGLRVVSADGGEPLRLTPASNKALVWSPDSQYIAFISVFEPNVYVIDRVGQGKVSVYREDKLEPLELIGWLP